MSEFIYFLFDPTKSRIKIGSSQRLLGRIFQLTGPSTEVLGIMPGTYADEQRLHEQYQHLRSAYPRERSTGHHHGDQGREWFRDTPELRNYIETHAKPWERAATFLWENQTPTFAMHGSDQWIAWLEALAHHVGTGTGRVVEDALAHYAHEKNFESTAPTLTVNT